MDIDERDLLLSLETKFSLFLSKIPIVVDATRGTFKQSCLIPVIAVTLDALTTYPYQTFLASIWSIRLITSSIFF